MNGDKIEKATLAAGCFWCVEAVFQRIKGVKSVVSGYTGGKTPNPDYKKVCSGNTGHAEAIQISFFPDIISFAEILEVFWNTHDPTTLNSQGNDYGTQYRSAIFFHDEKQKEIAINSKNEIGNSDLWKNPIVTEIVPFTQFFDAEDYHHNYYNENAFQPYCSFVISPKIKKLENYFSDRIKDDYKT